MEYHGYPTNDKPDAGYKVFGIGREEAYQVISAFHTKLKQAREESSLLTPDVKNLEALLQKAVQHLLLSRIVVRHLQKLEKLPEGFTTELTKKQRIELSQRPDIQAQYLEDVVKGTKTGRYWVDLAILHLLAQLKAVNLRVWKFGKANQLLAFSKKYAHYKHPKATETIDVVFHKKNVMRIQIVGLDPDKPHRPIYKLPAQHIIDMQQRTLEQWRLEPTPSTIEFSSDDPDDYAPEHVKHQVEPQKGHNHASPSPVDLLMETPQQADKKIPGCNSSN
jgi:hypothetical protein